MTLRLVVMGVSGCGKSTLGAALAARLGADFVDADDLHPAANVAKMRAGTPLTDADRAPWLDRVAGVLAAHERVVVACSALRRSYRDRLRAGAAGLVFVHPQGSAAELAERLARRQGHFMPPGLLASQLATLEPLQADEVGTTIDLRLAPPQQVAMVLDWLKHPARLWPDIS